MRRKLWQFRLRSLLLLVLLSALATAWWSHRRHCLVRAELHERQAAQDLLDANPSSNMAMRIISMKLLQAQISAKRPLADFDESVSVGKRIASSMRGGYLILPSESAASALFAVQQYSHQRENALKARAEFHAQQKEKYLRAIYRPWMNLREPPPPQVPDEPNAARP
jgi:hypothetical protein